MPAACAGAMLAKLSKTAAAAADFRIVFTMILPWNALIFGLS
jgi:hypothetical protein